MIRPRKYEYDGSTPGRNPSYQTVERAAQRRYCHRIMSDESNDQNWNGGSRSARPFSKTFFITDNGVESGSATSDFFNGF